MTFSRVNIVVLLIIIYGCSPKQSIEIDSGWQVLFEDPETFIQNGEANWTFEKDEICNVLKSGNGYLITNQKYRSFQLEFEFNPDATVNSGVFIRCKDAQMSHVSCYELNIWDKHPNQSNRTGSIVNIATPSSKVNTNGKWNTMKVIAQNNRIQIWINDILAMNYTEAESRSGVIGFQAFEEGKICFRNIRIREY